MKHFFNLYWAPERLDIPRPENMVPIQIPCGFPDVGISDGALGNVIENASGTPGSKD